MLETHRIDLQIIEAIESLRDGATIPEIHRWIYECGTDPLSIDTVKRHLPGLVRMGRVQGVKVFRDERLVTVWNASN